METDASRNKQLLELTRFLASIDYPDSERIAKEILLLTDNDAGKLQSVKKRLSKNEPWEYISNKAVFRGLNFYVDKDVLIPRIETEDLVEKVLKDIANLPSKYEKIRLIDIGTGSGCILISLYGELYECDRNLHFLGTDISEDALKIAKRNLSENFPKLRYEVLFLRSDLLEEVEVDKDSDLIIFTANLPYLSKKQIDSSDNSVKEWEPHIALFGGESEGEDIIRSYLQTLTTLPYPFIAYLEVDPSQVADLTNYYNQIGLGKVTSFKDRFDRERFIIINSL